MNQIHLSCPSWVIPGTYGENLAFLDDKLSIENIELLFFMYDPSVRRELEADLKTIIRYRGRFTYTAHLPDTVQPEHEELVERLLPLVNHFILHPANPEEPRRLDELARLIEAWSVRYGKRFLAENTKSSWLEALEARLPDIPVCMDTGHLGSEGAILGFWKRRKGRIRELHLHSIDEAAARLDGRLPDHRPLRGDEAWLEPLIAEIGQQKTQPLINLELFSWQEVEKSLSVLNTIIL